MSSLKKELRNVEDQRQSVEHPHNDSRLLAIEKLLDIFKLSNNVSVKYRILKILEKKNPTEKELEKNDVELSIKLYPWIKKLRLELMLPITETIEEDIIRASNLNGFNNFKNWGIPFSKTIGTEKTINENVVKINNAMEDLVVLYKIVGEYKMGILVAFSYNEIIDLLELVYNTHPLQEVRKIAGQALGKHAFVIWLHEFTILLHESMTILSEACGTTS